jgi:hypothetical protein
MPAFIEYIDAIARQKGRAVLYLEFHPHGQWRGYRYQDDCHRDALLSWLDGKGIAWHPCGPYADPAMILPWLGQVYVDVPFDEAVAAYRELRDHLEMPDGSMRQPGVRFYAMPLAFAAKNAAHDEPGFWGRVWENF